MPRLAPLALHLLGASILAFAAATAQASTADDDRMVAAGATTEGIFSRIVIRDNVGLGGAAGFADNPAFGGVAALGTGAGSFCSGALISPTVVLSARHCQPIAGNLVRFGASFSAASFSVAVASVSLPAGPGALLDGGDLALITLASAVPNSIASPFQLTADTTALVGAEVVTLGYGRRGLGSTGATAGTGLRLGGTNVLDRYGAAVNSGGVIGGTANIFSTDFDNPAGTTNTLGWLGSSATATVNEATTAGGDSGGPLLAQIGGQWVVMGALSGGSTNTSPYGDISWWTGVAPFRTQIEAAGGVFVAAIPEPGTYAMLALGLLVVGARLRRQAAG